MPFPIHRVARLDLRVVPWRWPFADARRAEIDAHFAELNAARRRSGTARLLAAAALNEDTFSADYFEPISPVSSRGATGTFPTHRCSTASAWAARAAATARIAGRDGGAHCQPGKVYFRRARRPRRHQEGRVDIAGSVAREVAEETGLTAADYRAAGHWDCVVAGSLIALMRGLDSDLDGEALRRRIEADLARQASPELAAIHLVRNARDITAAMPPYMAAFLAARLSDAV